MEHRITAPRNGVIDAVHVSVGDQVDNGQLLVSMAKSKEPTYANNRSNTVRS